MNRDQIIVIADQAAELAMLEAMPKLQISILQTIIYQRYQAAKMLHVSVAADFMDKYSDANENMIINQVLHSVGEASAIAPDEPTRLYYAVFAAVYRALIPFIPEPPAAQASAPKPDPKPGQAGYAKRIDAKAQSLNVPGLSKR